MSQATNIFHFCHVSGYPILTHTGTSWGYGALITIVPDLDLAIHTSITGPDTGYKGRRNLHLYIMDLLMKEEPWLNVTDVCTFPDTGRRKFLSIPRDGLSILPLHSYEGVYGNFGYGNITVTLPDNGTCLRMLYGKLGKWDLYPTAKPHRFVADGLDDVWSMDLANLYFQTNAAGDEVERLIVESFEARLPPVFIKGLKVTDAPLPPELCPKAEKVISGAITQNHQSVYSLILLTIFVSLIGKIS